MQPETFLNVGLSMKSEEVFHYSLYEEFNIFRSINTIPAVIMQWLHSNLTELQSISIVIYLFKVNLQTIPVDISNRFQ